MHEDEDILRYIVRIVGILRERFRTASHLPLHMLGETRKRAAIPALRVADQRRQFGPVVRLRHQAERLHSPQTLAPSEGFTPARLACFQLLTRLEIRGFQPIEALEAAHAQSEAL